MGKDLKEALDAIILLRADLQLAYFDRGMISAKEVREDLAEAAAVLAKHGVSDDMMDHERAERGE